MMTPRRNPSAQVASKGVGAKPWIKMRTDLWDDPRVSSLCGKLKTSEATIIGGLYRLWAMADSHSVDGGLPGLTGDALDHKAGIPGFAVALANVGWLVVDEAGITIPDFSVHNGQSAKSRAQGTRRQQNCRAREAASDSETYSVDVTPPSRNQRDASVTRLDETREDKKPPPPPSTNANDTLQSADWAAVEAELFELGLEAAGGTVELARQRDYTPGRVREAIGVWRGHPDWGPGAIHEHIKQTPASVAAAKGWWPKVGTKGKSSSNESRLQSYYGPLLDGLSDVELKKVMDATGIPVSSAGHCRSTPSLRKKLLAQLAGDDAKSSSSASR